MATTACWTTCAALSRSSMRIDTRLRMLANEWSFLGRAWLCRKLGAFEPRFRMRYRWVFFTLRAACILEKTPGGSYYVTIRRTSAPDTTTTAHTDMGEAITEAQDICDHSGHRITRWTFKI